MARTYFNRVNGFKSNTRGDFIQERSCSLEQLFQQVPKAVRMNIELSESAFPHTLIRLVVLILDRTPDAFRDG